MYEKKEYPQYNKNPLTLKYSMSSAEMIIFVNCLTSKTKLLNKHCLQASTSMHNMNTECYRKKMHLCTICRHYVDMYLTYYIHYYVK